MIQLLLAAGCFLAAISGTGDINTAKTDETPWYQGLPTASTAEELFGTHVFSTEGGDYELKIPETTESDTKILEELIVSDPDVRIPYNGRSEFVEIIAKVDGDTYVDVTSVVDWESEDYEIAYAYNGRIMAKNQGSTTITASLGGKAVSIDVAVENYMDLEGEIERLNNMQ